MPGTDSSCPRCGFQEMRDISFWKNENHICAECGAYWKTISDDRKNTSINIVAHGNTLNNNLILGNNAKSRLNFGKRDKANTNIDNHQNVIGDKKPSAVTRDFFEKIQGSNTGYVSDQKINKSDSRHQYLPALSFVNVATFAVVALTLVSLPQIGLFSVASQTIQDQVAFFRDDIGQIPQIDPIVTASISKEPKIAKEFKVGKIKFTRIAKGSQSQIVVHGMIRNVSGQNARTKPLRIVMMDKNGKEVQSWTYMVRDTTLEPGKIMRFRSTVNAVGYKAKSVKVVVLN